MYYAVPEYLRETTLLLFRVGCLFIRRKTAGLGAGNGFFHCLYKTASYGYANFHRGYRGSSVKSYTKGHYQRSVACDLAAHTLRPLEVTEKSLGRRPRAVKSEEVGGNRCKLTSSPCRRTHTHGAKEEHCSEREQRQHANREQDHLGSLFPAEKSHPPALH